MSDNEMEEGQEEENKGNSFANSPKWEQPLSIKIESKYIYPSQSIKKMKLLLSFLPSLASSTLSTTIRSKILTSGSITTSIIPHHESIQTHNASEVNYFY
ncbi:hypothetical protein LOAG_09648 [Loa loa]|uniref:Uncharacterized protein n=1 Tax=Loa loa TaxID=7209 RepID=A0A1S0TSQ3_LOALO|nr:hypothetical protein LOAG_09648 [Loa loa]EFO18849.1 hypothetical protein LOAG_09648 [Loa loa]